MVEAAIGGTTAPPPTNFIALCRWERVVKSSLVQKGQEHWLDKAASLAAPHDFQQR